MLKKIIGLLGVLVLLGSETAMAGHTDVSVEERLSRCMQEEVTFIPVAERVNLNTASVEQIRQKVRGIGQKRAEAIVAYRKAHGTFRNWRDLAQVKGLGGHFVDSHLQDLERHFVLG